MWPVAGRYDKPTQAGGIDSLESIAGPEMYTNSDSVHYVRSLDPPWIAAIEESEWISLEI
jgi:hypothetical protein